MIRVRLETNNGELVADTECILPFQKLPEIVMWGTRVFILHEVPLSLDSMPVYREGMLYCITGQEKNAIAQPSIAQTTSPETADTK